MMPQQLHVNRKTDDDDDVNDELNESAPIPMDSSFWFDTINLG